MGKEDDETNILPLSRMSDSDMVQGDGTGRQARSRKYF